MAAAGRVADPDTGVALEAARLLQGQATAAGGCGALFGGDGAVLAELRRLMEGADATVQARLSQLFVSTAGASAAACAAVVEAGGLAALFLALEASDDVLLRLAAVELAAELAGTEWGRQLVAARAVASLLPLLDPEGPDPLGRSLLLPSVLPLLATAAGVELAPTLLAACHHEICAGSDPALAAASLGAVATVAQAPGGRDALLARGELLGWIGAAAGTPSRMEPAAGHTLARLLRCPEPEPLFVACAAARGGAAALAAAICARAQLPVPDAQAAAFEALEALAEHPWGASLLLEAPGFPEWLLDRQALGVEPHAAREWKFSIVQRLVASSRADHPLLSALAQYAEQGPHYCRREDYGVSVANAAG